MYNKGRKVRIRFRNFEHLTRIAPEWEYEYLHLRIKKENEKLMSKSIRLAPTNDHLPGVLLLSGYFVATPGFTESRPTDDENNDATEIINFEKIFSSETETVRPTCYDWSDQTCLCATGHIYCWKISNQHQNSNIKNINNIEQRPEIHQWLIGAPAGKGSHRHWGKSRGENKLP